MAEMGKYQYVVIGGGIAGVSCAEMLSSLCEDGEILLITASELIKAVVNYKKVAHVMETFDVEEKPFLSVQNDCHNVKVIQDFVTSLNSSMHILNTESGRKIEYKKLCICTGGKPKVISKDNPFVLGIRDTESAKEFQKKLSSAKRIIIIGNGGIATELVYEIENCEVIWAIKDKSISHAFVDSGAATFFLPELNKEKTDEHKPMKRLKYTVGEASTMGKHGYVTGGALGPDWASNLNMAGTDQRSHNVHVEYQVEVQNIYTPDELKESGKNEALLTQFETDKHTDVRWPVYMELTNGKIYGCDFIVSATGVIPSTHCIQEGNMFNIADDGGIAVDDNMRTSVTDVFAAGDVCTASWDPAPHWLQMRLWTQARQMGAYAAKCMHVNTHGEDIQLDICFEMFSHVTKFFNYKVVLLGKFNAQGLENDHELLLRVTKGEEYVKAVLKDNRLYGAVLIGETDLEETFENLILNQTDLTDFKEELLNPNIDIEDFFD